MATDQELQRVADLAARGAAEAVARTTPDMEQIRVEIRKTASEVATAIAQTTAREAATLAVAETLSSFGLDVKERRETVKDFMFLTEMRKTVADSRKHVLMTLLALCVGGVCTALVFYAKSGFHG